MSDFASRLGPIPGDSKTPNPQAAAFVPKASAPAFVPGAATTPTPTPAPAPAPAPAAAEPTPAPVEDATPAPAVPAVPAVDPAAATEQEATDLLESSYEVAVKLADMQGDPNSPLFSAKRFEDLGMHVTPPPPAGPKI